jgi:hypothetical protein
MSDSTPATERTIPQPRPSGRNTNRRADESRRHYATVLSRAPDHLCGQRFFATNSHISSRVVPFVREPC